MVNSLGSPTDNDQATLTLKKAGYRFVTICAIGRTFARIEAGMLKKANVDFFGRVSYYKPMKATTEDRQLYGGSK